MRLTTATVFLGLSTFVVAHGGDHDDTEKQGSSAKEYALKHMAVEHHIDAFDLKSFFALHDLDSNGILDASEIEAIYGVHHTESQKKSSDEAAHTAKAQKIVRDVLVRMDTNRDGVISPEEFEAAGFEGLPDFSSLGVDGHHYDEESEFFLHHEEIYHSTPETQTDESYNHPEDIAHFQNHEKIELDEENKERVFQGLPELTPEEAAAQREHEHEAAPQVTDAAEPPEEAPRRSSPKFTRLKDVKDPKQKFAGAGREAREKAEWGQGEEGFKRPKTPSEKLRRNVPYKYKFRRNWGDF